MAEGTAEISIAKSPDDIWKLVRDFGGLEAYMPGVDACTLDGDVRTIAMMGMEIKEQLRSLDDDNRSIAYSVIKLPGDAQVTHTATITVEPAGDGSHVTWAVSVEPDDMLGLFVPTYEGALAALKAKLEA